MSNTLKSQTVTSFQRGDHKAFRLVFNTYYPYLVTFVARWVDNKAEAEDISMETFLALLNRCEQFETEEYIRAFLYVTARNRAINYLKSKKKHYLIELELGRHMNNDALLEYEYSIKADIIEAIYNDIESLPEECRRIFRMLYYDDLSPAEVADILNISINTVYTQRRRAMKKLRMQFFQSEL